MFASASISLALAFKDIDSPRPDGDWFQILMAAISCLLAIAGILLSRSKFEMAVLGVCVLFAGLIILAGAGARTPDGENALLAYLVFGSALIPTSLTVVAYNFWERIHARTN